MAKNVKKVETPGAGNENLANAQIQVGVIQGKANSIADAIVLNQAIIDNPEALDDEKEQAQLKINALQAAQNEIDVILGDAKSSLETIKVQAQTKAATGKKTDMSNITINKTRTKAITGANVELTEKGYVIKPRKAKEVIE